jgi:hypothetical protein
MIKEFMNKWFAQRERERNPENLQQEKITKKNI